MSDSLTAEQIDFLKPPLGVHGYVEVITEVHDPCTCCHNFRVTYIDHFFDLRIPNPDAGWPYIGFYFERGSMRYDRGTRSVVAFYATISKLSPNIIDAYDLTVKLGLSTTLMEEHYSGPV